MKYFFMFIILVHFVTNSLADEVHQNQDTEKYENANELNKIVQERGFHNSLIKISAIGGFALSRSCTIFTKEDDIYQKNKKSFPELASARDEHLGLLTTLEGYDATIMFPLINLRQEKNEILYGIKYGIIGRYEFLEYKEDITILKEDRNDDASSTKSFAKGSLMKYNRFFIGPELNFIFTPYENFYNFILRGFFLYGRISNGILTAVPALRDAGLSYNKSEYMTNLKGYSIGYGLGPHFVINSYFPVSIGTNIIYTYDKIKLRNAISLYNNNKKDYTIRATYLEIVLSIYI